MYIDWGGGVLRIMGYTERLHLKGVPFSGFRYSEREGFSLVEVYKMAREFESVISVSKRTRKGLQGEKIN